MEAGGGVEEDGGGVVLDGGGVEVDPPAPHLYTIEFVSKQASRQMLLSNLLFILSGPPHIWAGLPLQGIEQPLGAVAAVRVLPQKHSPPYSVPA